MHVTPREYQKLAVKAAKTGLMSLQMRALVVLATGLGKTLTAAFIVKEIRSKRILFLVHNNFILQHAVDEFSQVFDTNTKVAIYNGLSKKGAESAQIVFATWQTMRKNLKKWKRSHFDLIIVDEAHHAEAETWRPVVQYFTGRKLGITATPDREDEADIREIFGDEVINISLEEAIAKGWLPRIEYHVITDESLDEDALQKIVGEIRESKKRFTMGEVNRRIFIKKRDHEIARIINGYNEKAVVFCSSIEHAERISRSLILSGTFHSQKGSTQKGTWEKNKAILEALRDGTVRRVCAVNAFNEGVNVPSIGLVAFCRMTGVLTVFRQQLGRGLRPGKDKLIVLDFVGNLERIQLVLEMMNGISDLHEKYTPQEQLNNEGYVRERFEVSGKGFEFTFSDKVVDLMNILEHCERNLYLTWQEAGDAAFKLRIKTYGEYIGRYREDPQLPSTPEKFYADFPGYKVFLGKGDPKLPQYLTVSEASVAAQRLGIKTAAEYHKRYKEDKRLPSTPRVSYPDFPGFLVFLGTGKPRDRAYKYPTWVLASRAARKLGIESGVKYQKLYKQDPKLPSRPMDVYSDFPGWDKFFEKKQSYASCEQAMDATRRFRFTSRKDYESRCKSHDPLLPICPREKYSDFPGWSKYLGKE